MMMEITPRIAGMMVNIISKPRVDSAVCTSFGENPTDAINVSAMYAPTAQPIFCDMVDAEKINKLKSFPRKAANAEAGCKGRNR